MKPSPVPLSDAKEYLRVGADDDDLLIQRLLDAVGQELAHYIGPDMPTGDLPDDLQLAVLEQAAWHYDNRGEADVKPGLVPAAARIAARYKRVRL